MAGPRITEGVRVPLFDRLVATAAHPRTGDDRHDRRMLDRAGLRASIEREVERLLKTRTPLAIDRLARRPRSTLDYGLPDLSTFRPLDLDGERRLARLIEQTVTAFEPRLHAPQVAIERLADRRLAVQAVITGTVSLDGMAEPVTFPVLLEGAEGEDADV